MNRQLKKGIQKALEAPEPNRQEKERFLRTLPQPRISMLQFILLQAAYLRKWTLFLSVLLVFPALAGVYVTGINTLWTVSDFIPFLALLAVAESVRSMACGMDEFEMSARFSLKSVVLARMSVLGLLDVFLLCCCIPFCCIGSNVPTEMSAMPAISVEVSAMPAISVEVSAMAAMPVLQTGLYLFVPYLLTVNISLWMTRHFRGKEVVYVCTGVAILVSAANAGLHMTAGFVYQSVYVKWWLMLSALLAGAVIHETYRTIKQTEELAWNL